MRRNSDNSVRMIEEFRHALLLINPQVGNRGVIEGRCTRLRTGVTIDGHRPGCSKVLYTDEDEMIESMRTSHV
jgi:hypothetical protein